MAGESLPNLRNLSEPTTFAHPRFDEAIDLVMGDRENVNVKQLAVDLGMSSSFRALASAMRWHPQPWLLLASYREGAGIRGVTEAGTEARLRARFPESPCASCGELGHVEEACRGRGAIRCAECDLPISEHVEVHRVEPRGLRPSPTLREVMA